MQQQKQQTTQQQKQYRPLVVAVLTAPGGFNWPHEGWDVEVRNMSKSFARIRHNREAWKRKLKAVIEELKVPPIPEKIVVCVYPTFLDSTMVVLLSEFGTEIPVEVWVSRLTNDNPVFEPSQDEVFS
jgi:hypothetical protein